MFGYEVDGMLHKPLLELIHPQQRERLDISIASVQSSLHSERLELLAVRKEEIFFDVDIALAAVNDFDSKTPDIICSLRDISTAKKLEENLRQNLAKEQELNKLKTRFTAMVSHEFRTPLATIQSASDLLKHYHNKLTDEKRRDYLNKIQRQIRHLTDLIDNVLLVGKAEVMGISFAPSIINLELFCQNIVDEIQTISNQHQIVMITIGAESKINVGTTITIGFPRLGNP